MAVCHPRGLQADRVSSFWVETPILDACVFAIDIEALRQALARRQEISKLRQSSLLSGGRRLLSRSRGQYSFRASEPGPGRPAGPRQLARGLRSDGLKHLLILSAKTERTDSFFVAITRDTTTPMRSSLLEWRIS